MYLNDIMTVLTRVVSDISSRHLKIYDCNDSEPVNKTLCHTAVVVRHLTPPHVSSGSAFMPFT